MNPDSPNLSTAHSQTRSRTPEEREAQRRANFATKQQAAQSKRAAQDAQPVAGQGIDLDGGMVTATRRRGTGGSSVHTFMIQENGYITEWEIGDATFIRRLT